MLERIGQRGRWRSGDGRGEASEEHSATLSSRLATRDG